MAALNAFDAKLRRRVGKFASKDGRHNKWYAWKPGEKLLDEFPDCELVKQLGYKDDDARTEFYENVESSCWYNARGTGVIGLLEGADEGNTLKVEKYDSVWRKARWFLVRKRDEPPIFDKTPKDTWSRKFGRAAELSPLVAASPAKPQAQRPRPPPVATTGAQATPYPTRSTDQPPAPAPASPTRPRPKVKETSKAKYLRDRPPTSNKLSHVEKITISLPEIDEYGPDELARLCAWKVIDAAHKHSIRPPGSPRQLKTARLMAANNQSVDVQQLPISTGDGASTARRRSQETALAATWRSDNNPDAFLDDFARRHPMAFLRTASRRGVHVHQRMSAEATLALITEGNLGYRQCQVLKRYLLQQTGTPVLAVQSLVDDLKSKRRFDDTGFEFQMAEFKDSADKMVEIPCFRVSSLALALERSLDEHDYCERDFGEVPKGAVVTTLSADGGGGSTKVVLAEDYHIHDA